MARTSLTLLLTGLDSLFVLKLLLLDLGLAKNQINNRILKNRRLDLLLLLRAAVEMRHNLFRLFIR